jgi:AcrR family transcriptional regulator/DNA-binding MarR family transcriptional regulator
MGLPAAQAGRRKVRSRARHGLQQLPAAFARMSIHPAPLARLSPGRGRPARQHVIEIQRARMLAAAIDALEESGYDEMTVSAVIKRARVSRKTFYDVFANRGDCFTEVVEEVLARAYSVASAAYTAESSWLAAIRSALNSLLCLIDEEPRLARIWFVDALAGPEAVHERKAEVTAMLTAVVDRGRGMASESRQPSQLAAEATVGGISHILYTRVVNGHQQPFAELLGPCMYMIALPYLGNARATAELRRKRPARKPHQKAPDTPRRTETLHDLGLRLTYRTIRTLDVICQQPGINNRMVADESGIKDQGQMSKLLSRLERLALIENRGLGQDRGAPNAWHITPRGFELVRATNVDGVMRSRGAP